jgi:hypothetical protein
MVEVFVTKWENWAGTGLSFQPHPTDVLRPFQTFYVSASHKISYIKVAVLCKGDTGIGTCQIFLCDANGKPTGSPLTSGDFGTNYIGLQWLTINMSSIITVTAGNTYAIVMHYHLSSMLKWPEWLGTDLATFYLGRSGASWDTGATFRFGSNSFTFREKDTLGVIHEKYEDMPTYGAFYQPTRRAQTFTIHENHTIKYLSFFGKISSSNGGVYVYLYAVDSNDKVTGAPLVSVYRTSASMGYAYQWHEFTLVPTYAVTAGQRYAIVVKRQCTSGTLYLNWYYAPFNVSVSGEYRALGSPKRCEGKSGISTDDGVTWTMEYCDLVHGFEVWGKAI